MTDLQNQLVKVINKKKSTSESCKEVCGLPATPQKDSAQIITDPDSKPKPRQKTRRRPHPKPKPKPKPKPRQRKLNQDADLIQGQNLNQDMGIKFQDQIEEGF